MNALLNECLLAERAARYAVYEVAVHIWPTLIMPGELQSH